MALRQRVRAASASASLRFGHKPAADDVHAISFWLCEGLKKKSVRARKSASLETALREWDMLSVLDDPDLHFMNESTGIVVPRGDEMGQYISDRDVVRICSSDELTKLLDKFSTRDLDVDAEIMGSHKGNSSLGAALGKLRKIGNSSTTLKMIQKTFEERPSPHTADEAELLERFPEIDPVFESSDIEELPEDTPPKCDLCDVSWPDDATGHMHRLKRLGIVTHQGCAQFAADVLAQNPSITSRAQLVSGGANPSEVNQPGTFHVTVHRAMDLPGVQLLGTQAPYAKLSLLPWKEPFQTKAVENGGRNPLWKPAHDNATQFAHMYNSTITPIPLLEVEIWNANYLSDDLIACTLVDMTPLLRYPLVTAKRWFTLSSRIQAPLAMMSPSTGQPKVLLSIQFVPLEGKYMGGNEHKFRVHQLKSIGLAIPNCAVCDRVIVNVLKGAWGYRCEYCGIDVHKACIMKAMTRCECKRVMRDSVDSETQASVTRIQRHGMSFRVLNASPGARLVGELFVTLQGLHLCTKQCQQETNLHAKNIFDGDTYCRLVFEDVVHETSPVLKSADPMYHERVCFQSRVRNSVFRLEVIDFNSDTCIGEMAITLFQLLQRDADRFVATDPMLRKLREPLRRLVLSNDDSLHAVDSASARASSDAQDSAAQDALARSGRDCSRYMLYAPVSGGSEKPKKPIGYALLHAEYVEAKRDLLRMRLDDDDLLLAREVKDVTVESLRNTVDRFSRVVRTFQWLDMAYDNVISWKDKRTSAICLVVFVLACVFVDLEYVGAYILCGVLVYMLYQLHLRLEGVFVQRWVGYMDYDTEQIDQLKLHRPLAALRVAVHDAVVSSATDALLLQSQSLLKDAAAAAKLSLYVRIKYLPNDQKRRSDARSSGLLAGPRFIPSGYDETIVAWTHAVEKSRRPVWRHASAVESSTSSSSAAHSAATTFAPQFVSKQRKEFPFRNLNISWRHCVASCACARCVAARAAASSSSSSRSRAASYDSSSDSELATSTGEHCASGGIDHHAFYFPVPQAVRKNFTNRDDLAPWRVFPGVLQFELCLSVSGDAKETPDAVVATGSIPLKDVRARASATQEIVVPLSTTPAGALDSASGAAPASPSPPASDSDQLRVRVEFQVPSSSSSSSPSTRPSEHVPVPRRLSTDESASVPAPTPVRLSRKPHRASRAERSVSELVCESLVAKEPTAVLGGHFLDAFWKIKDTLRNVQHSISTACGTVASVENLLNWTHPWKTATAFVAVSVGMVVFALIPGRWLLLTFGLSEFAAGFIEDLPPSNHARNIVSNFLSSLPTDQDLIDVYDTEREVYLTRQRSAKERDEAETLRLRHHALWVGSVLSKGESERSYKSYFMAYRPYRFVLWKSAEDAESGAPPHLQLIFERVEAIVSKIDDSSFVFHVFGVTGSGAEEKRSFSFESFEKKELLQRIVQRSCDEGSERV